MEEIFNLLTTYGLKPESHDPQYLVDMVHQVLYDRRETRIALQQQASTSRIRQMSRSLGSDLQNRVT